MTLRIRSKKSVATLTKDMIDRKDGGKDIYEAPHIIKSWNIVVRAIDIGPPPSP